MELYEIKEKDIKLYEEVKQRILTSEAFRIKYFEFNFYSFCLYYFTNTFTTPSAQFHKDFCKELQDNLNVLFQGFRECWKTVYFKYYFIWNILYKKKRFQLFVAFDKKKAEAKLFDIAIQLQTNPKILNDFWQLYYNENKSTKQSQRKTIGEFITENKVKCKALGIWESIRWEVYWAEDWEHRPDLAWLDDIDTLKSTNTVEQILKNYTFVKQELIWWLWDNAQVVFLFNTIKFDWVWPRLWNEHKNQKSWSLKKIYYSVKNNPWEERLTPEFIEKKKELQGKSFDANFLGIAETVGSPVFAHSIIENLETPKYTTGKYKELRIYKKPTKHSLYWWDTSWWGVDGDYSSLVVRDEITLDLLACYYWHMAPDLLCDVIDELQALWYYWTIWIERNNTWLATIIEAEKRDWADQLYTEKTIDKITNKSTRKYWRTTSSKTRPVMISDYEKALRTWKIKQVDERWKDEMYWFVYNDNSRPEAQIWYHDDFIIWDSICLQMKEQDQILWFM